MGRGVLGASAGSSEEEHGGAGRSRRAAGLDLVRRRALWWAVAACVVGVAVAPRKYPTIEETRFDAAESAEALQRTIEDIKILPILPSKYFILSTDHPAYALNWHSVSCGGFHTCAIKRYFDSERGKAVGEMNSLNPDDAPGQIFCWGMNKYGQTDVPTRWSKPTDCAPSNEGIFCFDQDDGWRNISTGWLHTCGIQADGTMYCWGNNRHGELGYEKLWEGGAAGLSCKKDHKNDTCTATFQGKWALTPSGGVSAGKHQTCAIRCTGSPGERIVLDPYAGNGTDVDGLPAYKSKPNEWGKEGDAAPWTCGSGKVMCWGDDRFGQGASGVSSTMSETAQDVISVCAAASHSCAVRGNSGLLLCWGHNGNKRAEIPPKLVTRKWQAVSCRGAHTCGLMVPFANRSSLECWGHNAHGQSIVPRYTKRDYVPQNGSYKVPLIQALVYDRTVHTFSAGEYNTCALWDLSDEEQNCDRLKDLAPALNGECWGDGSYSQNKLPLRPLGHDPKQVCFTQLWRSVAAGSFHSCAITIDDAGTACAVDTQCSEYPDPLGNIDKNLPGYSIGDSIVHCPRTQANELGLAKGCVPARTNYMQCWGMDSHKQTTMPGQSAAERQVPGGAASLLLSLLLATALARGS